MISICERCGRKRLIEAKGLCKSCYTYLQFYKSKKSKEMLNKRTREWARKNKDYFKKWREKNKEYFREHQRNYRREKYNIPREKWRK